MRRNSFFAIALFVALGVLFLQLNTWAKSSAAIGSKAPNFKLEDQNGKSVQLSDFSGKVVVLEWINPDCPFVQRHAKAKTMATLSEKYKADVAWVGVNTTHYMSKEDNKKWAEKNNLSYPVLDDHTGAVGNLYGAKTTPHMFIVDKTGTLVYEGAIDDDPSGSNGSALNYVDKALGEIQSGKAVAVSETKAYGCSVKYAK